MNTIKTKWLKDLIIIGKANHKEISFDSRHKDHVDLEGSAPTRVFLMSIIGCSTMSIVATLNKEKLPFGGIEALINVETESSIDKPYGFTRFRLKYFVEGVSETNQQQLLDCIEISHQKYCPMVHMAEKISPVQYEVSLDGNLIFKSSNWKEREITSCDNEICDSYYAY